MKLNFKSENSESEYFLIRKEQRALFDFICMYTKITL